MMFADIYPSVQSVENLFTWEFSCIYFEKPSPLPPGGEGIGRLDLRKKVEKKNNKIKRSK
jgi:hypothetical protein